MVRPCSLSKAPFKDAKTSNVKSSMPQNQAISNHQS